MEGYEVLEELGRGQYGVVHKVRQRSSGRTLALKRINMAGDRARSEVALRECRLLSRLHHPNIISYYDAFLDQGEQRAASCGDPVPWPRRTPTYRGLFRY